MTAGQFQFWAQVRPDGSVFVIRQDPDGGTTQSRTYAADDPVAEWWRQELGVTRQ